MHRRNSDSCIVPAYLRCLTAVGLLSVSTLALAQGETSAPAASMATEAAPAAQLDPSMAATVVLTKETDGTDVTLAAKVTDKSGAPVAGVKVAFSVERLFGTMILEKVETDDSGVAAMPFPATLPGDAKTGDLTVTAALCDTTTRFGQATQTFPGGKSLATVADPFPREIWSPRTDWHLLLTIPVLLGAVWSVYVFALRQLFRIRRMTRSQA